MNAQANQTAESRSGCGSVPDRVDVLGCPFARVSHAETMRAIETAVLAHHRLQVVPANVDHVMKARRDLRFHEDLARADLVVADGVPVVWASRWLGRPLPERVSGTDLASDCARLSARHGFLVALAGGRHEVNLRAQTEMERRHPGARVRAFPSPFPLDGEASRRLAGEIRAAGAAIVVLALGAPRQERWIQAYLEDCGASVGMGVGSAMDILSGDKPRAPEWMRAHGLEWLQRLLLEPRRLARRYLVEDLPFFPLVVAQAIRQRRLLREDRS